MRRRDLDLLAQDLPILQLYIDLMMLAMYVLVILD